MASKHVLALDTKTERIVHIEVVPEGYKHCNCPQCGKSVIAANIHSNSRKVAYYFRHQGNSGCGLETALHRYAKELISTSKHAYLPPYEEIVRQDDKLGDAHEAMFTKQTENYRFDKVNMEERLELEGTVVTPDLTCTLESGEVVYIEIMVTHRVGQIKRSALCNSQKSTFEIDLSEVKLKDYISLQELNDFILQAAPRHWLVPSLFEEGIRRKQKSLAEYVLCINSKIDSEEKKAREEASRLRRQKKERRAEWLKENSQLFSSLEEFDSLDHRKSLIQQYMQRFDRANTNEYHLRQKYKEQFGGIPHLVNIPVDGELGFTTHRIIWQSEIMNKIIFPVYEKAKSAAEQRKQKVEQLYRDLRYDRSISKFDLPKFNPTSIYEELLKTDVEVSQLVLLSEAAARQPIKYEDYNQRPKLMSYMERRQYELIPKPVVAIRQYLLVLSDLKIFVSHEDSFQLISPTPPRRDMKVPNYDEYVSAGIKQYSV
jgi:hypothetical protein